MQLSGAHVLIQSLIDQGVDTIFGYPGGQVINIYDAIYEYADKIRHVLVAHEQGGAHAADGYARASGKPGVVIATSGPGATNLVTGIATAYLDSVPLVAITGNVPNDLLGRDTFQEVDITGITMPITKHNYIIKDAELLPGTIKEAFEIAASGRPGPVLIDITKSAQIQMIDYQPAGHYELRKNPPPSLESLELGAEMIRNAERPILYIGGGVISSEASDKILALAKKIQVPIVSSAMAVSAIPSYETLNLGMIGMHGTPVANKAVHQCDLLICVGARFSDRVTGSRDKFATRAKVLHIDIDASEIDKNIITKHNIIGDAKEVTSWLTQNIDAIDSRPWLHELIQFKAQYPLPSNAIDSGVDMRNVFSAIKKVMGDDTFVVTDVGQHQMITAQSYKFVKPRTFISSLGLGTMGYGMGAANGVQIAKPDSPVVLITGDGSIHMNLNELATAVTEQLPIVIFLMNNSVLGMVRQWQGLFFNHRYSCTTPNRKTDYQKLAEAFGGTGMRIENNGQILQTVQAAFDAARKKKAPCLVECIIHEDENVFPIIPPGGTADDMILAKN